MNTRVRIKIIIAAIVGLAAAGGLSVATAASDQNYTGCLKNGSLTNVAIGATPSSKCSTGADQVTWSEQGPQGPQGIQGAQGLQGEAGPAGPAGTVAPSKVYFLANGGSSMSPESGGHQVSMDLPAGSYVIEARAGLQNSGYTSDGVSAICRMPGGVVVFKFLNGRTDTDWHSTQEIVELTTAINHAGGPLEVLDCFSSSDSVSVGEITLLATPVGSVTGG